MKYSLRELILVVLLTGCVIGLIVQHRVHEKQRLQCERDYMRDRDHSVYARDINTWKLTDCSAVPNWVEHDADGDPLPTWVKHYESQ